VRTLTQWLAFQESLHPASIDLTLERVTQVARRLGVQRPGFPVITVGGTNGKGSTVSFCAALLRAAGAPTGQFTSPHFLRYSERIQVDAREVREEELVAAFERIETARGAISLTFFEFNTLAALLVFQQRGVRAAVLEVGLGGRLDATNLVDADVAVLCSVGMDHSDYLGDTLEKIGAEKAGIFRVGRAAVLGSPGMPASVWAALSGLGLEPAVAGTSFTWEVAADGRWRYDSPGLTLRDLPRPALAGAVQYRNAATALTAVQGLLERSPQLAGVALTPAGVALALATVRLAGRFQVLQRDGVEWILDIAHNEPAARVLAAQVAALAQLRRTDGQPGRTLAVVGVLKDKDAPAIAQLLSGHVDHWLLCGLPGPRGSPAQELLARTGLPAAKVSLAPAVEEGCAAAAAAARPGDRVLVFGSVYTVGPALAWLGAA
jgi:dihydrofolate synthase / folylpolyglutamate synthase